MKVRCGGPVDVIVFSVAKGSGLSRSPIVWHCAVMQLFIAVPGFQWGSVNCVKIVEIYLLRFKESRSYYLGVIVPQVVQDLLLALSGLHSLFIVVIVVSTSPLLILLEYNELCAFVLLH